MKHNSLLAKLKKQINQAQFISFDIFDTLLLRPYIQPKDLFYHLEFIENAPSFALARIQAEQVARNRAFPNEDISFDDIYEQIEERFKSFKNKELALEIQVLSANPEIKAIYDYAILQGKKIIIASDMYLSHDIIAQILEKNGFHHYEKLYVSSTYKKTKNIGSLFQHILNDLNVEARNIFHIGDNLHSDYHQARKAGLKAFYYPQLIQQFFKKNPRAAQFEQQTSDYSSPDSLSRNQLGVSILSSLFAKYWQLQKLNHIQTNYWQNLGYEYAGPSIYAYVNWIRKKAKKQNINHLLFIARDGYTLKRIFNCLDNKMKVDYIYAPRLLNLTCQLDFSETNRSTANDKRINLIHYFMNKDDILKERYQRAQETQTTPFEFIEKNIEKFKELSAIEHAAYTNYLNNIIKPNHRIGIVDTVTISFSSQKLLQTMLPHHTIHGFYWAILEPAPTKFFSHPFINYNNQHEMLHKVMTYNWDFMEFLMTSPEYPIKSISQEGQPIYDSSPTEYEKKRSNFYPYISDSALKFTKDIQNIFADHEIFLSPEIIIQYLNCFYKNPTKRDIKNMAEIFHAPDQNHREYLPLFSQRISFKQFIKQPRQSIQRLCHLHWHTRTQMLISCLLFPLKIKTYKRTRFDIYLFPKMKHQHVMINLSNRCKFVVGKYF